MKLKSELMLLATRSLAPLLAFAVVAVAIVIDHEQATREQEARAAGTSLD